jgi:hypothetical protein
MKMTRGLILGLFIVLLAQLTFLAQHKHAARPAHAAWAFNPQTLAAARDKASAIVIGKVVAIQQAPDTVVSVPGEPDGVVHMPSQRISVEILKQLKGKMRGNLVIDRYGTDTRSIADDPPYKLGEIYALFVEPKESEPGTYFTIAPAGRYRITNNKLELMPHVAVPFATELRGKDVAALEHALTQLP